MPSQRSWQRKCLVSTGSGVRVPLAAPQARVAEQADAADLKSADRKIVRVQVPPRAPSRTKSSHVMFNLFFLKGVGVKLQLLFWCSWCNGNTGDCGSFNISSILVLHPIQASGVSGQHSGLQNQRAWFESRDACH